MNSFVEQIKLYQLVKDSIWTVRKFQEENSQTMIGQFYEYIWEVDLSKSTRSKSLGRSSLDFSML